MCIMKNSRGGRGESRGPEHASLKSALKEVVGAAAATPPPAVKSQRVSALMYDCQQGKVDAVRAALQAPQGRRSVWKRDRSGKSALHYCSTSPAKVNSAQIADLLTMAAPDLIDSRDEDGFTPLHLAVIAGNMPLVTFLLASKADVAALDAEKHSVVHWATVCGETEALRAVLAAGAPISTPDVHGGYPLHYAAQMCGSYQEKEYEIGLVVLQTLLSHPGINVHIRDGDGRQPLLWAASAGSSRAMLALLKAGAAVEASDKDGLTALHCAASRGHTDCLDTLLTLCGASVDVIDTNGCTALHYSVTLGHADATALLLAHGANANRQDRKGRTPAHCGCAKGQFETVKMLHAHGANLWLRNARGDLPLHEAAGSGRRELVKWLLEMKPSNVNARNNDGRCPLHLAALNDNSDMCKILLDVGAVVNPVLRTSKNVFMTPLDCAMQRGFRSTAKYLQLQGGLPASKLQASTTGTIKVNLQDDIHLISDDEESDERSSDNVQRRRQKKRFVGKQKKEVTSVNTEVTLTEDNVLNIQQKRNLKVRDEKKDSKKVSNMTTQTSLEVNTQNVASPKINENIKEINTLAQSIEAKARNICKEVTNIEENLDRHSVTSYEEGPKQVVVEASVHEPPSDLGNKIDVAHAYQSIIRSFKEELESMKNEIRNIKRADEQTSKTQNLESDFVNFKDIKVLLEGRIKEIKDTMEEFKSDLVKKDIKNLDVGTMESIKGELKNLEKSAENIHKSVEEKDDTQISEVIENSIQVQSEDRKVTSDQVEETKAIIDLETEHQKISEEKPSFLEEIVEATAKQDQSKEINLLKLKDDQVLTDASIEKDAAFEVLSPAEASFQVMPSESEQIEPADSSNITETKKPEKHLHLPRDDILESSIDNGNNSESSFSSNATKREHKSFTVLQEQESQTPIGKRKDRRKLRSRSEENRIKKRFTGKPSDISQNEWSRRAKSNLESRIPLLPNLDDNKSGFKTKSDTNLHATSSRLKYREEELSEDDEENEGFKKKTSKRRAKRVTKSAGLQGSDYESSNLIDSGFEPSPRSTKIPRWRNVSDRGVNMTSVTQTIQGNIRRYHLERKIFQQLLELKRLQIRAGVHNEAILVKRSIDLYNRTCAATVGEGRYLPKDFTFKSFEKFLYDSLRKIQKNQAPEYLKRLPEYTTENPLFCTQSTNRCLHATHAYTGIPCAAYLPRMDHHSIPKIGYETVSCKPQGFLPNIGKNKAVTLELCHGNDKQIISLPTDRLDQNKRYYVTFTVKGNQSPEETESSEKIAHNEHSKSV